MRPAPAPAGSVTTVAVDMWEPELRDRAKAVLNRGTKIELAAADFATAEEFLTVAHAARNTQVPFMVLKHRVLNEQRTLADAIHELKPELDAKAEAARAREAARKARDLVRQHRGDGGGFLHRLLRWRRPCDRKRCVGLWGRGGGGDRFRLRRRSRWRLGIGLGLLFDLRMCRRAHQAGSENRQDHARLHHGNPA